jgi:hypothetical protein
MPKFILKRAYLGRDGLKKWESWPEKYNTYADALNAILDIDRQFADRRDPNHMGFEVRHGGKPAEGRFGVWYDQVTRRFINI